MHIFLWEIPSLASVDWDGVSACAFTIHDFASDACPAVLANVVPIVPLANVWRPLRGGLRTLNFTALVDGLENICVGLVRGTKRDDDFLGRKLTRCGEELVPN